tara:strand:+ start:10056 stop:10244 length:189 start_codon:yes stop_codon:yes gene_type:complete
MDNRSINPYDLRMLNIYLQENRISKEEYDKFVAELDDVTENMEEVKIELSEDEEKKEDLESL